jgi:hypothetical protein
MWNCFTNYRINIAADQGAYRKKGNYDNNAKVMFTFDIHRAVYKTHALVFGC